ncbi:MAG TPA: carbohydrate-binding protein [Kiritimatiellia bacterium]|nr:carbohydrate-binding protein [Kiritimatiellia bacterium]
MSSFKSFVFGVLAGCFLLLIGIAPQSLANGNVHVSRFWHNHQPTYWPEWNSNGDQNSRVQYAWDSIVLKPGQNYGGISPAYHPENDLGNIFGLDDRRNAYQYGPKNSLSTFSGGGFALSYSGSLIDNVRQLGGGGHLGYGGDWNSGNTEARGWGRLDLVGFTYHHSLAPLLPKEVFRKELQIFKQAWWKAWGGNSDLSDHSKGFFPTEMAYSRHLVDVLVDEGYEWTIVPSHHISRTCPTYFNYANPTGTYNIYSSPPNKADLLGPSPTSGWWYSEPNPGNAAWNVAPYAYQLHKVQYVNPDTGATKEMYAVPSDDVLSYRFGYANEGIGKINDNISPYATDPNRPVIVMPSSDGDNAWGGGSSSWMEATPQFFNDSASAGYNKNTPQGFVDAAKANAPVAHIEDGAWIFPEMDYGSPNFMKWIEPPLYNTAINATNRYDSTQADLVTPGFALKFFSYAPLMAGANWCITAEQIMRDQGGDVQAWKIQAPYDWNGSWTSPNDVELAWHIYLTGLDSGFNYYGGLGNDDENKPALATKRAIDKLQSYMSTRMHLDQTGPTVLKPQRFPYNPGAYTFGWFNYIPGGDTRYLKKMPSEFYIWTHAYDVNGITNVSVRVRLDNDGTNSLSTTHNETFAGGADVGGWMTVAMTKRELPKTRSALNTAAANGQIDYFVFDPAFWSNPVIADYYFVEINDGNVPGFRGKLLDYYVEAYDSLGNVHKSEIQHVFVEHDGGQSSVYPSAAFDPAAPSDCASITVNFNAATSPLATAATVNVFYHFSTNTNDWASAAMGRTSSNTFSHTFTTNDIPDNAPQLEVAFNDGTNWENNNGANWKVPIRDCDAPVGPSSVVFDPAAPDGCDPVTIRYYPNEGPLEEASAVKIHIGRNGWQDVISPDPSMSQNGYYWEYTYIMETNTTEINVVFNNGAGVWDNNSGADWSVAVSNCGEEEAPLPPVSISPTNPVGCGPITITYNPAGRVLLGADPVRIHIGRNGWQDVILPNPSMTKSGAYWTYVYTPPAGSTNINMVFNDGGATWDNNGGADWHFAVEGCEDLPTGLAITNPPSNITVPNSTETYDLSGIADGMEGVLSWSNTLTGASGTLPAAATWSLTNVALASGGNEIIVRGTNSAPPGVVTSAVDSASDAAYSDGWNSGNNGGTGFLGWSFNHTQDGETSWAGAFIADPANTGISGLGDTAFGFYANPFGSGANAEAIRNFSSPLGIGSTFRFDFGLNWDSNNEGSNRGFNLLAGDTELININMGNTQTITINGETLFSEYGTQAMPLSFEYVADGSIRVRGTGRNGLESYDQTLSVSTGAPSRIKFYFNATDSSDERQMYFNNLAITSPTAGGIQTNTDSVIITRTGTPILDAIEAQEGGRFALTIGSTIFGAEYAVYETPILVPTQNWQIVAGSAMTGTGADLEMVITNMVSTSAYYRIGYTLP